jgi:hypothetical protein
MPSLITRHPGFFTGNCNARVHLRNSKNTWTLQNAILVVSPSRVYFIKSLCPFIAPFRPPIYSLSPQNVQNQNIT